MGELVIVVVPLALIGPLILLNRWRAIVLAIAPLAVFEGALRKWILPGLQTEIYFLKDVLLLIALAGFMTYVKQRGSHERLLAGMKSLLIISLVYFSFQIANPNSPSPLVGLLGLKNYMLYVSLLLLVPYTFKSSLDFDTCMKYFMLLMIPVALLGLVQFMLPPSHWLNTYVVSDRDVVQHISEFGEGRARSAGTFSYIGGYATFVVTVFNLSLAYCIVAGRRIRDNWIPYALLVASTMAIFTTGSRWVLGGTLGALPFILLLVMVAGLMSMATFFRLAVVSIVVSLAAFYIAGDAIDAMFQRAAQSDNNIDRMLSPIEEMISAFEVAPVFGTGIGTTSNGSWILVGVRSLFDAWWLRGNFFEVETARVMQETGIIGFVLVYTIRITLIFWAVQMVMRLHTPVFKALSAAIAAYFTLHLGLFVINNPTAGIFYWFAAGLLFAMYRMDYEDCYSRPSIMSSLRRPTRFAVLATSKHS